MQNLQPNHALLIGKRSKTISELTRMLAAYVTDVIQIEEFIDHYRLPSKTHLDLVVIADSMVCMQDTKILADLKSKFPEAKILGLFEKWDENTEIELRRTGLIFLGTFEHLRKNFDGIIKTILNKSQNRISRQ